MPYRQEILYIQKIVKKVWFILNWIIMLGNF